MLHGIARTVDLDKHKKLLPDLVILQVELFEDLGVVLRLLFLALRYVRVQLRALLVSACLSLTLLKMLDLLLHVGRRAPVFDYLILDLLVLIEQLTELTTSFGHDVE